MRANIHSGRGTTLLFVLWIIITLAVWACRGADISAGYSFTPTDRVTSTKLNALVGSATITPTFLSGKNSAVPDVSDAFLFLPNGSTTYRQTTFANMVRDYTGLITAQTEDTTPATGDWLLTYDITGLGGFKKSQLNSVIFTNNALINARTNWPTPSRTTTSLLAYDSATGEHSKLTRSNLFYQFFEFNTWTNQLTHSAPTNTDRLLIWDSVAGTNKWISLSGMVTNLPTATAVYSTNLFAMVSNGTPYQLSYTILANSISNTINSGTSYPGSNALPANGSTATFTHGLAGIPQSVRVVAYFLSDDAANSGYTTGDEVGIEVIASNSGYMDAFAVKTSATTIAVRRNWDQLLLYRAGNGYAVESKISLKVYAIYRP